MSELSQAQFKKIADLAYERWGLHMPEKKFMLVSSRVTKFLRKRPFNGIDGYLKFLKTEANDEDYLEFFDLLSTNTTSFFRDNAHFEFLRNEFYAQILDGRRPCPDKKIRIWSAACSTGPEPYTLGINAFESLGADLAGYDVKILATDLSNTAVAAAKRAVYPIDEIEDIPDRVKKAYFMRGKGENADKARLKPHVRDLVSVSRMNLMEPWPMKGTFQVIFCRNVMIYFDPPTKKKLVERFWDLLEPGGILAVGSAESIAGLGTRFKTASANIYLKDESVGAKKAA